MGNTTERLSSGLRFHTSEKGISISGQSMLPLSGKVAFLYDDMPDTFFGRCGCDRCRAQNDLHQFHVRASHIKKAAALVGHLTGAGKRLVKEQYKKAMREAF